MSTRRKQKHSSSSSNSITTSKQKGKYDYEQAINHLYKISNTIYLEKGTYEQQQPKDIHEKPADAKPRKVQTPDDLKIDGKDYLLVPELVLYKNDGGMVTPNFIPHQTEPMNDFYSGIKQIVTEIFKVDVTVQPENMHEVDAKMLRSIDVVVRYTNVQLKKPTREKGGPMYPIEAVQLMRTYSGEMFVDAIITLRANHLDGHTDEVVQKVTNQKLCRIPIAVRTKLCNTYGKSREQLRNLDEDPDDPGGHFIIEGNEWLINTLENVEFNSLRVYKNLGFKNEFARGEFISKGGDGYENSDQFIIRLLQDGQLTIEIRRDSRIDSMKNMFIPFYVLFRAMGWSSDRDIIENIIGAPIEAYQNDGTQVDDAHATTMRQVLKIIKRAYEVQYEHFNGVKSKLTHDVQNEMLQELVQRGKFQTRESKVNKAEQVDAEVDDSAPAAVKQTNKKAIGIRKLHKETKLSEDNRKFLIGNMQKYFDVYFLEHVGTTPGVRDDKLRELSNMILEVILTAIGCNPETGRDDYSTKRMHTNGKSLSKQFKALFNLSAIYNTRKAITKSIKSNPYKKLNLAHILSAQIYGQKFESSFIRVIKQAKDTEIQVTPRKTITNRISAQLLTRKSNELYKFACQRQVNTPVGNANKASDRAVEIRRYHNSGTGFICPISSPEGQQVGINKGLALTAQITSSGDSALLKQIIMKDPEFTPLSKATPRMIYEKHLARIRVNGHCIGFVPDANKFREKYVSLRRQCKIDKHMSIIYDPRKNDVKFWVDDGRLIRPLIIVYNTWNNPERFKDDPEVNKRLHEPLSTRPFKQGILLTEQDIALIKSGRLILDQLIVEEVVEYVTVAEQSLNCLLACGPELLQKYARNPEYSYTHLDFPQEMLSITAMVAVYANCNQTPRNVFENNQAKHTAGEFMSTWPETTYKNTYIQHKNEYPVVSTRINAFVKPSGMNTIVDFACYTGYNEEDSSIMSAGAIDRGWCDTSKLTHYTAERSDNKRLFKKPDASNTRDIHPDANYNKLGPDAYVPVGTYIKKNDVLVATLADISADSRDHKYTYADRSLIYKSLENAFVYKVVKGTKTDGTEFIRICLRVIRKVSKGDKFSSRTGQKGICAFLYSDSDLPFSTDGVTPGVIMNPHAIPTRMTCGDLFEKIAGNWAASKGVHADCSMFFPHHIESYCDELKKMGKDPYAKEQCYNGFIGEPMQNPILRGVTYFQRLLKFVMDNFQSNPDGPLDPLTRQPVAGKSRDGGLRLGEMEKDGILSHGAMRFLMDKFSHHSDGHPLYICRNCRQFAVVNHAERIYSCKICNDKADICEVMSCWAAKAVLLEQQGMMFNIELGLRPYKVDRYV